MKQDNVRNILSVAFLTLGLGAILTIGYGGFRLYRWFNWTYGYEESVKQTIEDMVKPECLRK
jgi:hypothetical protein